MQRNKISFKGQKIFIGIDVHLKSWNVCAIPEVGPSREHVQQASAQALADYLKRHFPDGDYHAVYEAGFSGFSTYYALKDVGISCIIINAADVPTTQYEELMKTDRVDAAKLAKALKAGMLKSIYIRSLENLDDLSLLRIRKTIQRDLGAKKATVKHLLHTNGVSLPKRFSKPGTHWSGAFMQWLREDVHLLSPTRNSLDVLLTHVEAIRKSLLAATRKIRDLSRSERYAENFGLLLSIPGIGANVAMCLLTEVYDVSRFHNERQFASYLGLIPTSHSSGEKVSHGEKTFRGNKLLGPQLVEASWVSINHDPGLAAAYVAYKEKMKPQEAIIRIARKLSNIIYAVLKNKKKYVPYQWDDK